MMGTRGGFASYVLLPGIFPRLRQLFGSGFSVLSSLIAVLYCNLGLLPRGHAYLDPQNYGRFGVRHVVAEASKNLEYSRKRIDQVIIFYTTIAGLAILLLQFLLVFISLFFLHPVMASSFFNVFNLPTLADYRQDIAFVTLDRVFGVRDFWGAEGFFNSCIGSATPCIDIKGDTMYKPPFPTAFHTALHAMFQFYSLGIIFVAGAILLYYIVAIVGETIVTGRPFGKRLNRGWFIPRLIMFFALVTPMNVTALTLTSNNGINAAQFITLGVAKFGSNMATNAWTQFHTTITTAAGQTYLGDRTSLIARPVVPEMAEFVQFMFLVRMCAMGEEILNDIVIRPYVVRELDLTDPLALDALPYFASGTVSPGAPFAHVTPFRDAVDFSGSGTVTIRFGHWNPPSYVPMVDPSNPNPPGEYRGELGYVQPTCGEVVFNVENMNEYAIGSPAVFGIQENHYMAINEFFSNDDYLDQVAYCMLEAILPYDHHYGCVRDWTYAPPDSYDDAVSTAWIPLAYSPPTGPVQTHNTTWQRAEALYQMTQHYDRLNRLYITGDYVDPNGVFQYDPANILADIRLNYDFSVPVRIRERGWAGAALWYNEIASINGTVQTAVHNLPRPSRYPLVLERVAQEHIRHDTNFNWTDRFNPLLQNGRLASLPRAGDQYLAGALYSAYNGWETAQPNVTIFNKKSGNAILDFINSFLGINGLLSIVDNQGIHPLAMLSALGKGMIESSVRNLFIGGLAQGIGAALSEDLPGESTLSKGIGSLIYRLGMITLGIGFILYYVLPFLPFLYFFFAFGGWIKAIFEALVAMPLWALAHIKIDGEGLPGPWATNGYFLLLEILLRPTVIIFAFIASISVFSALVQVLHTSFSALVVSFGGTNIERIISPPTVASGSPYDIIPAATSYNMFSSVRGPLDEFLYTVIYVIMVYMVGMSCFKLIDQVPNNIMRWMGVAVSSFSGKTGDPAGELAGKMYRSAQTAGAQLDTIMGKTNAAIQNAITQQQFSSRPPGPTGV